MLWKLLSSRTAPRDLPAWLVEIATFMIAQLSHPDGSEALFESARHAHPSVAHAALYGMGDMGQRDGTVLNTLIAVASMNAPLLVEPLRGATYSLAVLRPGQREALEAGPPVMRREQLEALSWLRFSDDKTTASLAGWGLDGIARLDARRRTAGTTSIWGSRELYPLEPRSVRDELTAAARGFEIDLRETHTTTGSTETIGA
jgi:hypothetical protein